MDNNERKISLGTVISLGFILLGILNLFASGKYRRTTFSTASILPGMLFISIGVIILIIRANKKERG